VRIERAGVCAVRKQSLDMQARMRALRRCARVLQFLQ
jgi:hypothetical protein